MTSWIPNRRRTSATYKKISSSFVLLLTGSHLRSARLSIPLRPLPNHLFSGNTHSFRYHIKGLFMFLKLSYIFTRHNKCYRSIGKQHTSWGCNFMKRYSEFLVKMTLEWLLRKKYTRKMSYAFIRIANTTVNFKITPQNKTVGTLSNEKKAKNEVRWKLKKCSRQNLTNCQITAFKFLIQIFVLEKQIKIKKHKPSDQWRNCRADENKRQYAANIAKEMTLEYIRIN